jgi:hypothetical protein
LRFCRTYIVEQLTCACEKWAVAVRDSDTVALHAVINELSILHCSPAELRTAKGIGARTRASAVDTLSDQSVKAGILKLRARWVEIRNREKQFMVFVAQIMLQNFVPSPNVVCELVLTLLDLGFTSLLQLDGVNPCAWPLQSSSAKEYASYLCNSVSRTAESRKRAELNIAQVKAVLNGRPRDKALTPTVGPMKAIRNADLGSLTLQEKQFKLKSVALEVAITSVEKSLPAYKSGVRCYIAFYNEMIGGDAPFPPDLDLLLHWCSFFKNSGTLCNYLTHCKWATEACRLPVCVFAEPLLRRAKQCVKAITIPRAKMWIQLPLVEKLMSVAISESDLTSAALYALAYIFLARVASELFGMTFSRQESGPVPKARIRICSDEVSLTLASRKNEPLGSTLVRRCFCGRSKRVCPVHAVAHWIRSLPCGATPFKHLTPSKALFELRRRLQILNIPKHDCYGLHSFRRGGAQDMAQWGSSVIEIAHAGGWRSTAFLKYMRVEDLCTIAATSHICDLSDSDDEPHPTTRRSRRV